MVSSTMDFNKNIPPEIYEIFIQNDIGYSLLVKGTPGAGKTTFALTLISMLKNTKTFYISTRISPESIYKQFPWIKKFLKEENILNATKTFIPPLDNLLDFKNHIKNTINFNNIQDFLKNIFNKILALGDPRGSILIIDSWEAIIGQNNADECNWETYLTELVRSLGIKLILISESYKKSVLDYIVDGIIYLKDNEEIHNKILRELEISKIRTIERYQKYYNYTLFNNEFRYCEKYYIKANHQMPLDNTLNQKSIILEKQLIYPKKKGNTFYYSTGTQDLDWLYQGGLTLGSLNLWELESDVPLYAISNLIIPIIYNFIKINSGVIIYSVDGVNSRFIDKNNLFLVLSAEDIENKLRYLVETDLKETHGANALENRHYVKLFKKDRFNLVFAEEYNKLAEKVSYNPILSIINYDFLSHYYPYLKITKQFFEHLRFVKSYNLIEIGIINNFKLFDNQISLYNTEDNINEFSFFFDTHIKIIFRNNSIFIYGLKPSTDIFYVKFEYQKDVFMPIIRLIPMK
ncbi:MAG: RAD55 family ATPase [Promethearchaeota archaeon]